MIIKEFIKKMEDSYLDLKINLLQGTELIQSYLIKKHKWTTFNIPNHVLNFQIHTFCIMLDMVIINVILEDNQKSPVLKEFPVGLCPTCPNCAIYLSENQDDYCSDCGQPLNWKNYNNTNKNKENNNSNKHKIIGWEYQITMFKNGYYDIVANSNEKQLFQSKEQAELDALHLINLFLINKYNKPKSDFYITYMPIYNE